jgi:hypothetical protein
MKNKQQKLHLTMVFVWILLGIPTVLFWKQSILWVASMSLYANVVGHWSAYQGARAEEANADTVIDQ